MKPKGLTDSTNSTGRLGRRRNEFLLEVDRRLRKSHGADALGNKRNPLDELIYIQLSVRTRESAYQATYPALRRLVGGSWARLLELSDRQLLDALQGGGMATTKISRLRGITKGIRERFGRVSLAPLKKMSDADAEKILRALPGVGPKVARCVLLYSLDRNVFPVDTHCRRVLTRLGVMRERVDIKASHDYLQPLVPVGIRRSLHMNLVHHGRSVCVPRRPKCASCVLLDLCCSKFAQRERREANCSSSPSARAGSRTLKRRAARSACARLDT